MSWLWSGNPSSPAKRTADGAIEAPNRTDRAKCWAARDAFFECLDKNGIIDSIKDSEATEKSCGQFDVQLQRDCATSWVTYFKQRRVMEHKKKTMIAGLEKEGAQKMPGVLPPGAASAARGGSA